MKWNKLYSKIGSLYSYIPKKFLKGIAFPPLRVAFILTHKCNLKCEMCFVWFQVNKENKKQLTTSEIIQVINQTPSYSVLTFTGGEPFVREDIWDLINYASLKRKLHLVSNATLIDEKAVKKLLKYSAKNLFSKGLISFGISLEGPPEIHDKIVKVKGAFNHSIEVIKMTSKLKENRYPIVDVKVVLTKDNYEALEDLFEISENAGADLFSLQIQNNQTSSYGIEDGKEDAHLYFPEPVPEIEPNKLRIVIENLIKRAENSHTQLRFNPQMPIKHLINRYQNIFEKDSFSCDTLWTTIHIGPYGDVYPCYSYSMGNVRSSPLLKIWNNQKYRNFRIELLKAQIFPGCVGCCVLKYIGK